MLAGASHVEAAALVCTERTERAKYLIREHYNIFTFLLRESGYSFCGRASNAV